MRLFTISALVLGLLATSLPVIAGGNEVRLEARLTSKVSLASGKARYERRDDRLRLTVEGEDLPAGISQVVIYVADAKFLVSVSPFGTFDLNLDSRDRDSVPKLASGDVVKVTVDGKLLLSGTF